MIQSIGTQVSNTIEESTKVAKMTLPKAKANPKIKSGPKTQKALGLSALKKLGFTGNQRLNYVWIPASNPDVFYDETGWESPISEISHFGAFWGADKVFVRPCPIVPRHGYLDSYMAQRENLLEAVKKTAQEVAADDPNGEIVIMPYIDSKYNMIHNQSTLVIGPGNDGATSAKDSLTFSTAPIDYGFVGLKDYGVTDTPYMEVVVSNMTNESIMTQLRNGPSIKTNDLLRYIPREIVYTYAHLIKVDVNMSLPEWEKKVTTLDPRRHILWIPGGSLASHFGVHAVINGLTLICDEEFPFEEGAVLEKNTGDDASTGDINLLHFRAGFYHGVGEAKSTEQIYNKKHAIQVALYFLHNSPFIDFRMDMNAYLFGWTLAWICKLGVAACIGEARHGGNLVGGVVHKKKGVKRDSIYNKFLSKPFVFQNKNVAHAWKMFGMTWSSDAYGGVRWQKCLEATMMLWNASLAFANGALPNRGRLSLIPALNGVIQAAHNSSAMLTKFIGSQIFDLAANAPGVMIFQAAPVMYEVWKSKSMEVDNKILAKMKPMTILEGGSYVIV